MKKTHSIILGVAGAAVATAVIGGILLNNVSDQGKQGDRSESSYLTDQATSGEMDKYLEQIRLYDKEKQELLDSLAFYQGSATIQESYYAVSGMEGDTPVVGSAAMVSEDIIVYDESTDKCYLLARRISLLGDSVKFFDIPRIYEGTITLKVCGNLTEYYGNGILQAYDIADAIEGKKGYYLSFSANPIRFDCGAEIINTNPPVKNTYWVQVIGTDSVDMVETGVFTPEELPYVEVGLMPGLDRLFGEKSYNSNHTLIYEYTGGKVAPQGSFLFNYKKMSYGEVKDFLDELKAEAQKDKQLDDAVETLSDVWKDALSVEQEMKTLIDASEGIRSYSEHFSGESSVDASVAKNKADMLANGSEFSGELIRATEALDTIESRGGSLRKLEDFSMDGGEDDRRRAADAVKSLLPVLEKYLSVYRDVVVNLQNNTADLRTALSGKTALSANELNIMEEIRTGVEELKRLSTYSSRLSSDFYSALLSFDQTVKAKETEFTALARLCGIWEATLQDFLSGEVPAVDMENGISIPSDYPSDIVPIPQSAVVVICDTDTDGTIMLTLKTDMASEEVHEYYKSALSNTQDLTSSAMNGMWTLTGTKGDFEVSILVSANQLGGNERTMVQITLMPT